MKPSDSGKRAPEERHRTYLHLALDYKYHCSLSSSQAETAGSVSAVHRCISPSCFITHLIPRGKVWIPELLRCLFCTRTLLKDSWFSVLGIFYAAQQKHTEWIIGAEIQRSVNENKRHINHLERSIHKLLLGFKSFLAVNTTQETVGSRALQSSTKPPFWKYSVEHEKSAWMRRA